MPIRPFIEVANNFVYNAVANPNFMVSADNIGDVIANNVIPALIDGISDTFIDMAAAQIDLSFFQIPVNQFGAMVELIGSTLPVGDDIPSTEDGTIIHDHVRINPKIKATYSTQPVDTNYPVTIDNFALRQLALARGVGSVAPIVAKQMHDLWESIKRDQDMLVPVMLGYLYQQLPATSYRVVTDFEPSSMSKVDWVQGILEQLSSTIRTLGYMRNRSLNTLGAEVVTPREQLRLVFFDNQINVGAPTFLDQIQSQMGTGAYARYGSLAEYLGVEVVSMWSPGLLTSSIARGNGLPSFPGMQTVDMTGATFTNPFPNLRMALVQRTAANVGLKDLVGDTQRSGRAKTTQIWVRQRLQLSAGGFGNAIFFQTAGQS